MNEAAPSPVVRPASAEDWPAIERLLTDRGLPAAGARSHLHCFVVVAEGPVVVACAGIERYGAVGLLRSVAVAESLAGHGLGTKLVTALLEQARGLGLRAVYLLTTTAAEYFPRFGFEMIPREGLPSSLTASEELCGACPASAVAMRIGL